MVFALQVDTKALHHALESGREVRGFGLRLIPRESQGSRLITRLRGQPSEQVGTQLFFLLVKSSYLSCWLLFGDNLAFVCSEYCLEPPEIDVGVHHCLELLEVELAALEDLADCLLTQVNAVGLEQLDELVDVEGTGAITIEVLEDGLDDFPLFDFLLGHKILPTNHALWLWSGRLLRLVGVEPGLLPQPFLGVEFCHARRASERLLQALRRLAGKELREEPLLFRRVECQPTQPVG